MNEDTPTYAAAVQMHELYSVYRLAGFTRMEALLLIVGHIIGASLIQGTQGE